MNICQVFREMFYMFTFLDTLMKTRLFSFLVLVGVLTIYAILFSMLEMAYSQQRSNSLTLLENQNINLTMGKPIYIEF
jgi:hypothetical protein